MIHADSIIHNPMVCVISGFYILGIVGQSYFANDLISDISIDFYYPFSALFLDSTILEIVGQSDTWNHIIYLSH